MRMIDEILFFVCAMLFAVVRLTLAIFIERADLIEEGAFCTSSLPTAVRGRGVIVHGRGVQRMALCLPKAPKQSKKITFWEVCTKLPP